MMEEGAFRADYTKVLPGRECRICTRSMPFTDLAFPPQTPSSNVLLSVKLCGVQSTLTECVQRLPHHFPS